MASANATSPLDPSGGALTEEFHRFPDLPAEIRIQIWQFAFSAIPYTRVYRFRLEFSRIPYPKARNARVSKKHAFLVPLQEVGYLTRECRNLRRVNTESRHETERYFDGYLRLNQSEKGGTAGDFPPINIPWKEDENVLCFVGLEQHDLTWLKRASMVFIAQAFSTIASLGFDVDRQYEDGFTALGDPYDIDFASLIIRFPKIRKVVLVSDLLMTEARLDNINNDVRSRYRLESWIDWVGRVPEPIIGFHVNNPQVVTKESHVRVLEAFAEVVDWFADNYPESAELLRGMEYGMAFRTEKDLNFLLEPAEMLDNDSSSDGSSDESNTDLFEETSDEDGDA